MDELGSIPQIIYIDTSQVNNIFSMMNQGKVTEILKRSRELDTSNKGIGIKKILQLQYSKGDEDEVETEVVKKMNEVGKFAVIYSMLLDNSSIAYFDDQDVQRDDLGEGDFVEARGEIQSSPLNELQERFDQVSPFINLMKEAGVEEAQELDDLEMDGAENNVGMDFIQRMIEELGSGSPLYRLQAEGSDANFVFNLTDGGFQDQQSKKQFPGDYTEYRLLCRIEHVYSESEEEHLLDMFELVDESDREAKVQKKRALSQLSDALSQSVGRKVDKSELKITSPDIRVRPMALYIF